MSHAAKFLMLYDPNSKCYAVKKMQIPSYQTGIKMLMNNIMVITMPRQRAGGLDTEAKDSPSKDVLLRDAHFFFKFAQSAFQFWMLWTSSGSASGGMYCRH